MSTKDKWLWTYRVVRSLLFTAIAVVAVLYVGLYVTLSVPSVQDKVRRVAIEELSALVGSRVEIGEVTINPFNEVVVRGLDLYQPQPDGRQCLHVEKVGAGISIWDLLAHRRVIITYAELIGLQADVWQSRQGEPLNIQFLIDAFAPKDKSKPPAKFDLCIRNIVIRKSALSFHRQWQPARTDRAIDFNHITLTGLSADVALPTLSDHGIDIDLRRLALTVNESLEIRRLAAKAYIEKGDISLTDFSLELPNTSLTVSDITLPLGHYGGDMRRMLRERSFDIEVRGEHLVPSEFAGFLPQLESLQTPFTLILKGSGNINGVTLSRLQLDNRYEDFTLRVADATLHGAGEGAPELSVPELHLHAGRHIMSTVASIIPGSAGMQERLTGLAPVDIEAAVEWNFAPKTGNAKLKLESGYGPLDLTATAEEAGGAMRLHTEFATDGIAIGRLLPDSRMGKVVLQGHAEGVYDSHATASATPSQGKVGTMIERLNRILPEARAEIDMVSAEINGYTLSDLTVSIDKTPDSTIVMAGCDDENFRISLNGELHPDGEATTLQLGADIQHLYPQVLVPIGGKLRDCVISGELDIDVAGLSADALHGRLDIDHLRLQPVTHGRAPLTLNHLGLFASEDSGDGLRRYTLDSDWIDGNVAGNFNPSQLPATVKRLIADVMPASSGIAPDEENTETAQSDESRHVAAATPHSPLCHSESAPAEQPAASQGNWLEYDFRLMRGGSWMEFLGLPVKLLYEADIYGEINEAEGLLTFGLRAPYIQQGRDKLIQQTRLDATISGGEGKMDFYSSIPTKKGVLDLEADLRARGGEYDLLLGFNKEKKGEFYGDLHVSASLHPSLSREGQQLTATILPTTLWLNNAGWEIGKAGIRYADRQIDVQGFSVSHADQFVAIDGVASADPESEINVRLHDIDLDYIFDTLNINYVAFGGHASGEAVGKGLLSGNPEAYTRCLRVKDLSYNHAVLGDGDLRGDFDATAKRVGIRADIAEAGHHVALIDGGIWLGRDSLSFGVEADKVRIGFLQTFMSAFSSKVDGRASGNAKLFGTFKDIDMAGRLYADTISLKVDYTNVTYCGSDSVWIEPGRITIPSFRLHDMAGNSAILQGTLTHNYFHDPSFRFSINGARNLLVYDTDATMNPIWYGRIYGTGSGQIIGRPGYVGILADMTTVGQSAFTFVLSDSQEAYDYKFLTFTDRRKEARLKEEAEAADPESPDEIVAAFNRKVAEEAADESVFAMDIRASITPSARLTIVMDPIAGDKITAHGAGAMNLTYNSESNDIKMYGKYTLSEGTYNFSLQDLILKDFIIKPGSSISFNGDPLNGLLDIRAAYRVNTNLTDLDKSFATDHDLNRTNVPVDAMLLVKGEMTQPDITFDIELPTLNDEVAQKVRSIISSEDMMNRQIIYLLALNRFYTPEYMGSGNTGGEWASVASSTLSSQLTNMLGQLTDKVNIAPSLRSDKGDFSDLEVDLALSSRLFNNRLLINGNFGYRDRTSSSTTFIGDFDIEYLITRSGSVRLKAYNHFNDQNYYLKSALTTQGLGVAWRKDFDRLFGHRRRKGAIPLPAPAPAASGQGAPGAGEASPAPEEAPGEESPLPEDIPAGAALPEEEEEPRQAD
ncbi:MAG: translocation/assembly module TamB [Muribaculaceae bacterium]|nr:translocation/assembly module TamB [Muribaculaceae bacterium]